MVVSATTTIRACTFLVKCANIICLVLPVMGKLTVLSFQASSMHVELAKNPLGRHGRAEASQIDRIDGFLRSSPRRRPTTQSTRVSPPNESLPHRVVARVCLKAVAPSSAPSPLSRRAFLGLCFREAIVSGNDSGKQDDAK